MLLSYEITPHPNSHLPGHVSKFFESPLQSTLPDMKMSPDALKYNHIENKEEEEENSNKRMNGIHHNLTINTAVDSLSLPSSLNIDNIKDTNNYSNINNTNTTTNTTTTNTTVINKNISRLSPTPPLTPSSNESKLLNQPTIQLESEQKILQKQTIEQKSEILNISEQNNQKQNQKQQSIEKVEETINTSINSSNNKNINKNVDNKTITQLEEEKKLISNNELKSNQLDEKLSNTTHNNKLNDDVRNKTIKSPVNNRINNNDNSNDNTMLGTSNHTINQTTTNNSNNNNSDHFHAVAGTGSRVSATLIKKLSESKLNQDDSSQPSENSPKSNYGETQGQSQVNQNAALNWLEQQMNDDSLSIQENNLRDQETSPFRRLGSSSDTPQKSPVTTPNNIDSPYLESSNKKSMIRSLFLPTHSTIMEEESRDDGHSGPLSHSLPNIDEDVPETLITNPPLINTQPRKFLTKYAIGTMSSLTDDDEVDDNDKDEKDQNPISKQTILNLSPNARKKTFMKRRSSISTTAPRATFDDDDDDEDEINDNKSNTSNKSNKSNKVNNNNNNNNNNNTEQEQENEQEQQQDGSPRIFSGKFSIPKLSIDEYDENFFEREGEESVHASICRSQSGDNSEYSLPSVNHSVTDSINWKKSSGTGIRKTRREKRQTPVSKRGRPTLSTTKNVQKWDVTPSTAEMIRATMEERINGEETRFDEFHNVGSTPGLEIWIVDVGSLRLLNEQERGIFYNADCYLILSTQSLSAINDTSKYLTSYIHTWIGSKAEKDKCAIAVFKAQCLSKYLGGIHITTNLEGEETDEFIEVMIGNIQILDGSITQTTLKNSQIRRSSRYNETTVKLLQVSGGQTTSLFPSLVTGSSSDTHKTHILHAIPILRENFKSTSALILDTGEDLIYQWRGSLISQVARAKVFEAAFSLRSERIRQFPKCRIEVIDEGHEPEYFWEIVDKHSIIEEGDENELNEDENEEDYEDDDDEDEYYDDEDDDNIDDDGDDNDNDNDEDNNISIQDPEDREILYDLPDIREYCADQMDGHSEMQRRQVISQSRILDPHAFNLKDSSLETDKIGRENHINLYRIGYVDGRLHTSRLSGMNSEGIDFGPPKKSQLETKGVYLLDFKDEVYVWVGKESDLDLRVAAMTVAKALLQHSKAEWVRVVKVIEGSEPMLFKTKFPGWHEENMQQHGFRLRWNRLSIAQNKAPGKLTQMKHDIEESVNYMKHKRKRKTLLTSKYRTIVRSQIATLERHALHDVLADDDGKGIAVVWKIDDSELKTVPKSEIGHFWTHEAYVILYGFTPNISQDDDIQNNNNNNNNENKSNNNNSNRGNNNNNNNHYPNFNSNNNKKNSYNEDDNTENNTNNSYNGEEEYNKDNLTKPEVSPHFVIYFWQGPHTPEKAYPQWKLSILPQKKEEWISQMGQLPPEIRVVQGREPLHFFKIFKHRYIIHFPFLSLIKHRNKAEEKVRLVQAEILKLEKLRSNNLPVPRRPYRRVSGVFSPTNSRQLLNAARASPKTSPSSRSPLYRDSSFTSIDSSVADDISSRTTPVGKSSFQMEISSGVLLFHVKGSGLIDEDVHAVQIEARASRLNSSDCFIAIRPYSSGQSFVWLWVGRGTQYYEQEAAGALAVKILKWVDREAKGNQVRVVEEGAGEWFNRWIAKSFYRALGGFSLYTNFDLLQTPRYLRPYALRYPQLFVCEYIRDEYTITMLERYCQADLIETAAIILDAHYALFVWYGRNCTASVKVTSYKVAKKFLGSLKKGKRRLERPVVEVEQDQEPAPFISCFHGWCDWKLLNKPYVDPRRIRLEVRQSMGLLGDMAPYIGKPIEGLTPAQAQVLTKEYKKRQAKMKKKEEAKSPEKTSIRTRLRIAQKQIMDQNSQRNITEEVVHVSADASYKSSACVPPPDHILQAMKESGIHEDLEPITGITPISIDKNDAIPTQLDDHNKQQESKVSEAFETNESKVAQLRQKFQTKKLTTTSANNKLNSNSVSLTSPRSKFSLSKSQQSLGSSISKSSPDSNELNSQSKISPQRQFLHSNSKKSSPSTSDHYDSSTKSLVSPGDTTSSRLRRERLNQTKSIPTTPFSYTKASSIQAIPNLSLEPLEKSERKPYINYLKQKTPQKNTENK